MLGLGTHAGLESTSLHCKCGNEIYIKAMLDKISRQAGEKCAYLKGLIFEKMLQACCTTPCYFKAQTTWEETCMNGNDMDE